MDRDSLLDSHKRFCRLADYLSSKAPPGKLPGRQHIDPVEITDLLPYVTLIDVIRQAGGEPRYRIRLTGTEVVELVGADYTGKFADEFLTATEGAKIIRQYAEMLRTHEPQYLRGVVAVRGRTYMHYERVAFPLARDGDNVDMIIFVLGKIGPEAK